MHNESTVQSTRDKPLPNSVPTENTNRTPLHEAASNGDEAAVEALLAAGADRNAKESLHGNTPLHEAAWKGYSRSVKILCSLPKVHKPGATGIQPSNGGGPKLSIDLIKDSSSKIKSVIQDTKGALHSALLGTRNFGGFSALHLAAQNGHNQSCREILLAGADPDVQNNYGDTPLHTACRYGHAGAIRILLSAKCDFERINLNGDTALHIACAMGRRKLTRILLEAGCKQDTKNAQDETPRDIAIRKNLIEILNILNTPVQISSRHARERSSSSSHRKVRDGKSGERSRSKEDRKSRDKSRGRSGYDQQCDVDPQHWSPYGCHYFPDPRNFPSPKLETLPKEPLATGEQYFLDLAGNIRKGPVGVGNTCYCAPFFKHLEQRMNQNRKSIRKYVHRATEKLDSRMTALAMKTDDQIEELTKTMIASRVQCENKRLHLEQWLKRGIAERSTGPHNSKTRKDEANTNTLTRCRSLELLDGSDDILEDRMKSSTPQFSRSIDFLDSQDLVPEHKRPDYHSDHFESSNNSNMKNHSEAEDSSRRTPLRKFDAEHRNGSKRSSSISHSGHDSYCYSDKDNDKEKNNVIYQDRVPSSAYGGNSSKEDRKVCSSAGSSSYDHKNEKIKVTERLEELLSKTKKILELEKITKKKHGDNRYILALDRLKDIHHYDNNPQVYHQTSSKRDTTVHGYDIAQEMEKITQSLLPAAPVSPEISKDITTRKERSSNSQSSYRNPSASALNGHSSASTPHSTMSPSSSLLGGQQSAAAIHAAYHETHMTSTSFNETMSEITSYQESECETHVDSVNAPMVNGFYANNCFEDLPSSSNTTIKSAPNHSRKKLTGEGGDRRQEDEDSGSDEEDEDEEEDEDDGHIVDDADPGNTEKDWESDDQCDLSDMANLAQLKELKSRILNGTSWRSQVLQKSVQDLFQKATETTEQLSNQDLVDPETSQNPAEEMSDQNRVKYIISKLQNSTIQQVEPPTNLHALAHDDNFSDSSEDEDDLDCVDGPPPMGDRPITAKSLIEMYEKTLPKVENQPVAAIRQQYFVPKDAYFHELPNKPKPPLKPPDLTSHLSNPTLPDQIPISAHARSRNPLPSYLNDNEIFNPNQSPFPQSSLPDRVQSTPTLYYPSPSPQFMNGHDYPTSYHQHYIPHVPVQEKLLSSRKYINPSAASFALSGCSTGTPSPEFPYHHQMASSHFHQPHQPHLHQPHPQQQQQFRKSQDNLSNDDSGYISAKVSEIHGPAANGRSLSPRQPTAEVIPMPRQFIPYNMANTAAAMLGEGAVGGSAAGPTANVYDEQPHYNLGASSLV